MNIVEYLTLSLAEEAAEVAQAASKCGRFGYLDAHPLQEMVPNNKLLVQEINDLLGIAELLKEKGIDLSGIGDRDAITAKKVKVLKWASYAKERGTVDW